MNLILCRGGNKYNLKRKKGCFDSFKIISSFLKVGTGLPGQHSKKAVHSRTAAPL